MAEGQGLREAASTLVGIGSGVLGRSSSVLMPYIWAILIAASLGVGGYFAWDKIKLNRLLKEDGRQEQVIRDHQAVEEWRRKADRLHSKGLTDEDIDRLLGKRALDR